MPRAKSLATPTKRQRWTPEHARAILERQASSGLTVQELAERERIEPSRLYYWRERLGVSKGIGHELAASAASRPERAAFVEVRSHRPSRIELVLVAAVIALIARMHRSIWSSPNPWLI